MKILVAMLAVLFYIFIFVFAHKYAKYRNYKDWNYCRKCKRKLDYNEYRSITIEGKVLCEKCLEVENG